MITFTRNVAGIFVSENRNRDVNNFNETLRASAPGFLGISFQGNSDELDFHFDENVINHSSAIDALELALSDYSVTSTDISKIAKKDQINRMRDQRLYDHFPYAGYRWDCNSESRANIIGANTLSVLNGGHLPAGMVWRDFDNNNHPANATFMALMGGAMFAYSNACYVASWQLKAQLAALTNPTDIDNFNFMDGWPSMDP